MNKTLIKTKTLPSKHEALSSNASTKCRKKNHKNELLTNVQHRPTWNCHNESLVYNEYILIKKLMGKKWIARCWWLTPVILATQEVEIRRIVVRSQPGQIVHKTPSRKNPSQKRAGGVGPESNPCVHTHTHTHTHTHKRLRRSQLY
jgi:hypothetical protein